MRRIVFASAFLLSVFGLALFLGNISKAVLTIGVGEATGEDEPLLSEEAGSFKGPSSTQQRRKRIPSGVPSQERQWAAVSEQQRKATALLSAQRKRNGPSPSTDRLSLGQTRQMLLPYTKSLQMRATQAGLPRHPAARLAAEVAEVALRAQLAGASPAQAIGTARVFGEKALGSSIRRQQAVNLRSELVRKSEVLRQEQRRETIQRMKRLQK